MLLTTKEIAQKWGVSVTWVTILCKKGRIKGAVRDGNRWYIPEDAKKPADRRTNKEAPGKNLDLWICLLVLEAFIRQ